MDTQPPMITGPDGNDRPARLGLTARPTFSIDARAVWRGDAAECGRLYRQFAGPFLGSFAAIRDYYGWTRPAMVAALRAGRPS